MINRQSVAICFSSQVLNNIFKCWFCVTQQEKNHFLFSAQSHANVSPSVHFSLLFPTTDDCVHTNTHTQRTTVPVKEAQCIQSLFRAPLTFLSSYVAALCLRCQIHCSPLQSTLYIETCLQSGFDLWQEPLTDIHVH